MTSRRKPEIHITESENNADISEEMDSSSDEDDSFNNMMNCSTRSKRSFTPVKNASPKKICRNDIMEESKYYKKTTKHNIYKPEKFREKSMSNINLQTVILFFTGLVICSCVYSYVIIRDVENNLESKCLLNKTLQQSKICKQKQDNTCQVISRGIESAVLYPEKPYIFVLLAQSTQREVVKCLSLTIASLSSCALNSSRSLIIPPERLSRNTDEVIFNLRPLVEQHKSVIFNDLLNMNVPALVSLHNFCDTYNPLVTPAIYIIIIISDEPVDYNNRKNITKTVNGLLKKKFSDNIDGNKIQPLISRITDGPILAVRSEKSSEASEKCSVTQDNFVYY